MADAELLRLQVYLARCGIASRRKCEDLISAGRIKVNGVVLREMGAKVDPAADRVEFDNVPVTREKRYVYLALNKPAGYLCSNDDPYGRPLASELLQNDFPERLFHVGRLDYHSRGLILYTNDGIFADLASHPSWGVEKEYIVEGGKNIAPSLLDAFQSGISVGSTVYTCRGYEIISLKKVKITLVEGKNREIRKVFQHFQIPLKGLTRVRFGPVTLGDVGSGKYRRLTQEEINFFYTKGGHA
jgi:23S rRNA pseudouridine2605 synthase